MARSFDRHYRVWSLLDRIRYTPFAIVALLILLTLVLFPVGLNMGFNRIGESLGFLPDIYSLEYKQWGIFTYMWIHNSPWHLIVNVSLLYPLAQVFVRRYSNRFFWISFIGGGIAGGAIYTLCYTLLRTGLKTSFLPLPLLGSSAAILCIFAILSFGGISISVQLPVWGKLQIRSIGYIVAGLIFLEFVGSTTGILSSHLGSASAHSGGMLAGYLIAWFDKRNRRISERGKAIQTQFQTERQAILNKIRQSGYSSLNSSEKEILLNRNRDAQKR